ncbi:3D domain-containing protein [Deinococcus hopiensis]|uniref:3D (Asp-Asp-Asp) domain-containing protein n=1 Tax=Deinococcus hopiensis KR-140 TaxID=695939 RepID=A0A1W1VFT6_9DEIO|nr:3D domain-containing protein [Deinococcus hopiensis]SMB92222.1 3D (Asp-Asp-Asp) domain-containing protein [Deinococcus hopiensis KR-140]
MSNTFGRWMRTLLLGTLGTASAAPFLPSSQLAAQAVREALGTPAARPTAAPAVRTPVARAAASAAAAPAAGRSAVQAAPKAAVPKVAAKSPAAAPRPVAARPTPQAGRQAPAPASPAAQARARGVALAQSQAARPQTGRSIVARATAYNSMPGQTDSSPFVTATGTRTRPGVVALSRDLLRTFPYGSKVMIEDLSGRSGALLNGRVFYVEDTMAAYKTRSVDIWMSSYSQAIHFGGRQVRITAVR